MNDKQFLSMVQSMQNNNNNLARKSADTAFQQSMIAQHDAQSFNSNEAAINRQFQLGMSNTSHQREIADLQAAGLNPILSANNGAAVTSGATASSGQAQAQKAEIDMQAANLYAQWVMNETNNALSLKINRMNNANALRMTKISAAAQMASASTAAAAQMAAAATSAEASKYVARKNYAANEYSQKQMTKRTTMQALTDYQIAKLNSETNKRGQDFGLAGSAISSTSNYLASVNNSRGR